MALIEIEDKIKGTKVILHVLIIRNSCTWGVNIRIFKQLMKSSVDLKSRKI